MSVSDNDVTFDDSPKSTARISDEQLDDVFTNVRIEDIGVKYSDNKEDADMPQAKGSSFEDIDAAVNTVKAPKATDKEKRHAGKVFHEMDVNQFYANIRKHVIKLFVRNPCRTLWKIVKCHVIIRYGHGFCLFLFRFLAAFNVWTIYFYNKLLLEVANNKEEEEKPSIDPMALVGKSLFLHVVFPCP